MKTTAIAAVLATASAAAQTAPPLQQAPEGDSILAYVLPFPANGCTQDGLMLQKDFTATLIAMPFPRPKTVIQIRNTIHHMVHSLDAAFEDAAFSTNQQSLTASYRAGVEPPEMQKYLNTLSSIATSTDQELGTIIGPNTEWRFSIKKTGNTVLQAVGCL